MRATDWPITHGGLTEEVDAEDDGLQELDLALGERRGVRGVRRQPERDEEALHLDCRHPEAGGELRPRDAGTGTERHPGGEEHEPAVLMGVDHLLERDPESAQPLEEIEAARGAGRRGIVESGPLVVGRSHDPADTPAAMEPSRMVARLRAFG
jgi:hypothetical protein